MVQFNSQRQLYELKLKMLEEAEHFYQQDIEYMKLKQENMTKGIVCLKSYMYDSLTPEQKKESESKLQQIDVSISSLNRNVEINSEQHRVRVQFMQNQTLEKLGSLTCVIEQSV